MKLSVFVTNLGAYNNGDLIGEWFDLPYEDGELEALLERIGNPEEIFITDYESDFGLEVGEYDSLSALNEQMQELADVDGDAVAALVESGQNFGEALKIAEEGNYSFYAEQDLSDVAAEYVSMMGLPEFAERYFDYAAFERDLGFEGWCDTSYGAICVNW